MTVKREDWRFFLNHAGYCTPPGRAQCALDLARAEQQAKDRGWIVCCQSDEDGWATFGVLDAYWVAVLLEPAEHWNDQDEILAALSGVDVTDAEAPDYWRVLGAELAAEALCGLAGSALRGASRYVMRADQEGEA